MLMRRVENVCVYFPPYPTRFVQYLLGKYMAGISVGLPSTLIDTVYEIKSLLLHIRKRKVSFLSQAVRP
jgi:hypothetical protein